jgi:hypothetical protein
MQKKNATTRDFPKPPSNFKTWESVVFAVACSFRVRRNGYYDLAKEKEEANSELPARWVAEETISRSRGNTFQPVIQKNKRCGVLMYRTVHTWHRSLESISKFRSELPCYHDVEMRIP